MRRAWILLVLWLFGQGYTQTSIDYAADFGGFEYSTMGTGIADGWSVWRNFGGSASHEEVGLFFQLTRSRAVEGQRSQEIRIARAAGEGEMLTCSAGVIRPDWDTAFLPELGTPLLVRLWVQTENLTNISVRVLVVTGQRTVVLAQLPANSIGWTPISAVVPLEANAEGRPRMDLRIEFTLRGNASGRVWLDGVQVLQSGFSSFIRARPNILKFAHVNSPMPHWKLLLTPPVDFLIAPLPHSSAIANILPGVSTAIYINVAQTSNRQPPSYFDLYGGYEFVSDNHPDWFLLRSGQRFSNPAYPDLWPLNIGLASVRQRAIERLNAIHAEISMPEWIFFDNAGSWWSCDQYPTRTDILPRWTEYFQTVFNHVRQNLNRKVILNGGSHAGAYLDGNEGTRWIQYVDGVLLEHVITFLGGDPRTFRYQNYRLNRATSPHTDSTWWATLRAINAYPNKKWVIMAMNHPDRDPSMFRYILASYFVMAHENTYLMVEARETGETNLYHLWVNRPEVWIPLGNPRGGWRVQAGTVNDASGALFAREFENGIVLVNPTENQTYEYTLPRSYKDWDGNVLPGGTRLQIDPKQGVALYAAPEIVMSLSPQQITALPGDIVTFTVQYRNNGLVDATNVKISVPLPEGLEFVSSSTGGQYLNQQITWTLPQVRVGQSGTLTFQARIQ
ncbi:MAG: hypothetical protein KatS3mg016_1437 [Fimbriimonadales bacterium]|nr:MAG: hypothetical protein KatS3mg016_1437 [Fimbriimonadales bacterium]